MEFPVESLQISAVHNFDFYSVDSDIHEEGQFCAVCFEDDSLAFFDLLANQLRTTVYAKEHGLGLVRFTHHPECVLVSSRPNSHEQPIRYLSLRENKFISLFQGFVLSLSSIHSHIHIHTFLSTGHQEPVLSMSMSPSNDLFLSSSASSVLLTSLASPHPIAALSLPPSSSRPLCAFDGEGVVFAVSCEAEGGGKASVKLFDVRNYEPGPFLTASLPVSSPPASLRFSPDGKWIALGTSQGSTHLLDAFSCECMHVLSAQEEESSDGSESERRKVPPPSCAFAPDSSTLFSTLGNPLFPLSTGLFLRFRVCL